MGSDDVECLSLWRTSLRRNKGVCIRRSPTHRWGVFASERIRQYDIIEEAPYFEVPNEQVEDEDEVDRYTYHLTPYSKLVGMGYAGLYNHNADPNACYEIDYINEVIRHYAIREISPNEEIVIDYGQENTERFNLVNT